MTERRPGSRRSRALAREAGVGGYEPPQPWLEFIGVDFVCRRHPGQVLGRFRRDTFDGADPRMRMEVLPPGILPEHDNVGHAQVRLVCALCRTDVVLAGAKVEAALDALYAPHRRRVLTQRV